MKLNMDFKCIDTTMKIHTFGLLCNIILVYKKFVWWFLNKQYSYQIII